MEYTKALEEIQALLDAAYAKTSKLKEAAYEASYMDKLGYKIQAEADILADRLLDLNGDFMIAANYASERGL